MTHGSFPLLAVDGSNTTITIAMGPTARFWVEEGTCPYLVIEAGTCEVVLELVDDVTESPEASAVTEALLAAARRLHELSAAARR